MMRRWFIAFLFLLCIVQLSFASSIILVWEYVQSSTSATTFAIYRRAGTSDYKLLASTASSKLTYTDTAVTDGVTYCYQITAVSEFGEESAPSDGGCYRLLLSAPVVPVNVQGTVSKDTITKDTIVTEPVVVPAQ